MTSSKDSFSGSTEKNLEDFSPISPYHITSDSIRSDHRKRNSFFGTSQVEAYPYLMPRSSLPKNLDQQPLSPEQKLDSLFKDNLLFPISKKIVSSVDSATLAEKLENSNLNDFSVDHKLSTSPLISNSQISSSPQITPLLSQNIPSSILPSVSITSFPSLTCPPNSSSLPDSNISPSNPSEMFSSVNHTQLVLTQQSSEQNSFTSIKNFRNLSVEKVGISTDLPLGMVSSPQNASNNPHPSTLLSNESPVNLSKKELTPINKILSTHIKDTNSVHLDLTPTSYPWSSNQGATLSSLSPKSTFDRDFPPINGNPKEGSRHTLIGSEHIKSNSNLTSYTKHSLKRRRNTGFFESSSLVAQAGQTPARVTKKTFLSRKISTTSRSLVPAKRSHSPPCSEKKNNDIPQIPLMEQLRQLESKLPERFLVKPTVRNFSPPSRRLTKPVSPKLRTSIRCKVHPQPLPDPAPRPFKARPVNPRILSSKGNLGVPRIAKNKPTVARSPKFSRPRSTSCQPKPFHPAISVPRRKPTVARPFNFATDRIAEFKKLELDRKLQLQKQEEVQKRKFKARPMPTFTPEPLKPRCQRPSTIPQEFSFMSEARVEYHRQLKLNKPTMKPSSPPPFRARPVPKFHSNKVIRVSSRPPTKPVPFHLHSDQRMEQRRQYELQRQLKLVEEQRREECEHQKQVEREQAQLRRLRSQLVPKAHPVPKFKFFQVKKSTKPLTEPRSPNIGKRRRLV